MISFTNRFHGHNSLRYVYKNGQIIRSRLATLKYSTNPNRKKTRIAVVVSKKVIKSAVSRNRIRRRLYEYLRLQLPQLSQNFDIVIIVTSSELMTMPSSEFTTQINQLMSQSNLYKKT